MTTEDHRYSEQEVYMMISGLYQLIEREQSLLKMVDAKGKRQIHYFIKKYRTLIGKLTSEI